MVVERVDLTDADYDERVAENAATWNASLIPVTEIVKSKYEQTRQEKIKNAMWRGASKFSIVFHVSIFSRISWNFELSAYFEDFE